MHEVLVNRLGGLSLPRKSVVRLTDRPDMTLDVYRGRKTTMQQQNATKKPCLKVFWFRKDNPTGHSERKKKKRQTEEEVRRQNRKVDRNGLCQLN